MSKTITTKNWTKRWAGSYTFISASYWGKQYKTSLERELGIGFNYTLFIHKKGTVSFFVLKEELEKFGTTLAKQASKDNQRALLWCKKLKESTDTITEIMKQLHGTIPTFKEYQEFLTAFDRHLPYHNAIKKPIDYFSKETMTELLPYFNDARLYSEHVYSDTEKFFRNLMEKIAQEENYNANNLTCLTQNELEVYMQEQKLPPEEMLQSRFQSSVLYFENTTELIITGNKAIGIEKEIAKKLTKHSKEVKGMPAYKGKATGTARIVPDPHNVGTFNNGDILITGMTRPEFLPIMKKAAAIVTDAGGVLCHAAISARELKIPCVVGTQTATSTFQNDDMITVDADNGKIYKA